MQYRPFSLNQRGDIFPARSGRTFVSPRSSFGALLCASLLLSLLAASSAFAQNVKATFAPAVTASAAPEQARFLAPNEVAQMRLEVFDAGGARLYDSDFKPGNLFDWNLQDQQGQHLPDGAYRCLLTVKDVAGRESQRQGLLLVQAGETAWQSPEQAETALRAFNPLSTAERVEFFTTVPAGKGLAAAALAHDGNEGRLMAGNGSLSIRTGDFFAGKDQEQMRLTAEGKLGVGVTDPQAKLDVGGLIRTSEGIVFPDGTIQTTAFAASGHNPGERGGLKRDAHDRVVAEADEPGKPAMSVKNERLTPNISGSGTTNQLTKWGDGPSGVVSDSTISEVGGNIGIGTSAPGGALDLQRSSALDILQRFWNTGSGGAKLRYVAATGATSQMQLTDNAEWLMAIAGNNSIGMQFRVRDTSAPNTEAQLNASARMTILRSGRIGIGTTAPFGQMEVVNNGAVSTLVSTAYGVDNLVFGRATGGSQAAPTATTNGQNLLFIGGIGHNGAGFPLSTSVAINLEASQTWTSTANGSRITFGTTENGTNNRVERMRIEHHGNVGIGTTTPSSNNKLDVASSDAATAIQGESTRTNGNGVVGIADTGSIAYGIWGKSSSGLAGKFSGNVDITGSISKGSGSFKIDHPLDPENKYLYHSFVESPDMLNIYNGNITTDATGEAEITLPDWFEALNRDFRYQLTVIGQFAQAIVAEKISGNRFKIRTSLPQVEVSWQVTGIRQDAFAERHRIPVEELKPEIERGSYLYPAAFGQPEEKGVDWARRPTEMRRMKEAREQAQQPTPPTSKSDAGKQ